MSAASGVFQWPDLPLKIASICSRVLPFVSGMTAIVKMTLMRQKEENNQKVPALVRRFWKRGQLYRHAGLCWKGWAVSYGLLINNRIFLLKLCWLSPPINGKKEMQKLVMQGATSYSYNTASYCCCAKSHGGWQTSEMLKKKLPCWCGKGFYIQQFGRNLCKQKMLTNQFVSVSIHCFGHNYWAESRHIRKNAPKAFFFFLKGTHHHILKGFGDNKRHAPVGKDAHSTGNSPHFDGENLWHDQPWDWTPTKSKTWTQKQDTWCDTLNPENHHICLGWLGLFGEWVIQY